MVDLEPRPLENSRAKKKKRKLRSALEEKVERRSKTSRVEVPVKEDNEHDEETEGRGTSQQLEEGPPWMNLQLILSLQNKEFDTHKKVELAFNYAKLKNSEDKDGTIEGSETVSASRVIVFLNNWVQSLLISSEKEIRGERDELIGNSGYCLDHRCWEILKFCLENSLKLHVSLSFSKHFLGVVRCILRDLLYRLKFVRVDANNSLLSAEVFKYYETVLACISLVFSSHGGVSNDNINLWIATVGVVIELAQKVLLDKVDCGKVGVVVLQLSCFLLEPFSKFLRVHPTRKTDFRDFIGKLLEPLLCLLDVLQCHVHDNNTEWRNLFNLVEEVLRQGLFHVTNIDGFLSLKSGGKYIESGSEELGNIKTVNKSYHRLLFEKLEKIIAGKNATALGGVGMLFGLFVGCIKMQKGVPDNNHSLTNVNAETRKSILDLFVQIMEPLLLETNAYLQVEMEIGQFLIDVHCMLKSMNKILISFVQDMVYVRTDDSSAGFCFNFLKWDYDMIKSYFPKVNQLWSSTFDIDKEIDKEVLKLVAKEFIIMLGSLMEIEYGVVVNDLESLWLLMLSYAALGHSFTEEPGECTLFHEILQLGCKLINLYGELRQVNNAIFALCKAVRRLISGNSDGLYCLNLISSFSSVQCELYAQSARVLLCSQDFGLAIHNAINSTPEGQASGCIQELAKDISESLAWLKINCSDTENDVEEGDTYTKLRMDMRAEVLGKGLSELYCLIIESLTVATGNSNLIGNSVEDLMILVRPTMNTLVAAQPDCVNKFLSIVFGGTYNCAARSRSSFLSSCWVVLFVFRLYMSCRSLYRQVISLVSPDTSKKMSEVMNDSYTAYSGRDWLESSASKDEGYFSWIIQPSASLLTVIQTISDIYLQESVVDCSPLIYAVNAMALQRIVDLNRLIKNFEYLLQSNDYLIQKKAVDDDDDMSQYLKKAKKWKKHLSVFRQEAAELTNFMLGYLPLVEKDLVTAPISDDAPYKDISARALQKKIAWNFIVGEIDENSLPSAFWWIVCQNIDIWSIHAAKKELKTFLSRLIQNSIPFSKSSLDGCRNQKSRSLKAVTLHQISLELLSNTILYEQRFVRRYIASRFCQILEKSIAPIFRDFRELDLSSSPNWPEFLGELPDTSHIVSGYGKIMKGSSSVRQRRKKCCKVTKTFPLTTSAFTQCESLLTLLCWMPKGCLNSRSFSLFGANILNLERLLVGSLLGSRCASCLVYHYELFRLFVSCRRTLKYLLLASYEGSEDASQPSLANVLSESSLPILWLLNSLSTVIELQHELAEDPATQVKDVIFSLMDHTSYVFLTISKGQSINAVHFLVHAIKPSEEQHCSDVVHEQSVLIKSDVCLDSSKFTDAWNILVVIADTLKEQTRKVHLSLKEAICEAKVEGCSGVLELGRLSAIISCFQGFLWGLASAFDQTDAKVWDNRAKLSKLNFELICKVNSCIDVFVNFINYFLHMLLLEDDQSPQSLCEAQTSSTMDCNYGLLENSSGEGSGGVPDIMYTSSSSGIKDHLNENGQVKRRRSQNRDAYSILNKVDLFEQRNFNKSLLHRFLKGEKPEAAFFLRQLFIASSAVMRLNLRMNFNSLLSSSVPVFIGISEVLLLEFANNAVAPQLFSFVWLDGVVKFLEELGSRFPLSNPTISTTIYNRLIDLHLRAMGKCISVQGKDATLASHETESSSKTLNVQMAVLESPLSRMRHCLDEFKVRLRTSFKIFVRKPSDLHLLSAIQALERALVGVEEGCQTVYKVYIGSSDGGNVSSIVAAAIDCLDLFLEFVAGPKRFSLDSDQIQRLVACLFNIVVHLQGPVIFYRIVKPEIGNADHPDSGSVILMCVEVLNRVFGKHSLFQMHTSHVGQCLRIPAALFQNFLQLRISDPKHGTTASSSFNVVDRQFSVDLYAASCRLLCTVLKHHKSECERGIGLLQNSVLVLLHCLEMTNVDPVVIKDNFAWEVQEGEKCAGFLRRIYEEMRQQKDVYGQYCFQFLSNYIWIYSGHGPLKAGFRREVDEALKPGVYALIDACSADDLQHLHTVFGEGPCRSTLAALQHEYKLKFQYEGKV